MAQAMRRDEDSGPPGGSQLGDARDRIAAVAARSPADAAYVDVLLDTVAIVVERPRVAAPLPTAERDLWASVGASFDGARESDNDRKVIDAFARLLDRSLIGDAAMASALSVDRTRISQRLAEPSLYAFRAGDERCFPRWQVVAGKALRGLHPVLSALDPELHPLRVDRWFTTPHVDLEVDGEPVAPVTWLASGGAPEAATALVPGR